MVKEITLKGTSERNNGRAKATDNLYDIDQRIIQEQVWEEISKWVIEEVRGIFWIRDNEVPFWGVVVGNAQLKVVGISGL